ncbi:IclR family transcriptional regulator [Agromyces seonyuensis]|uniref:Helix-turn-helix domain-containing protein n=1 Tax=Agromyces seonyuensis TaxID=2662446 RepID=A0A6I4NTH7_9MICO|nr:IclR family transcriptional regulator [Agromyces seonyuensis]MWB97550.1 helix-turn-helix domain-containing protein [Agromyces seonyuensis]
MSTTTDAVESSETSRRRQPLARGIELLTYMVESPKDAHGVRELAGRLDVSPSTAHRLITDLEKLGLVRRAEVGTSYRLGLEFLRLAWLTTDRYPSQELALGVLHELVSETGESAFSSLYNEQRRSMMFTTAVESPHPLRYTLPLQQWLPLHGGASGLAILAYTPDEVQREVAYGPLTKLTPDTVTDPESLLERLAEIRRDGYAITHSERIEGAVAIAAPVFGLTPGSVAGAAGISIPEFRFDQSKTLELAHAVRRAADRISANISGQRLDA